jgi:signal transduction histidine kinase
MRLTLLYGALFLLSGAVLLAITYGLAWNATTPQASPDTIIVSSKHKQAELAQQHASEVHQRAADMHQLLASSGIALLITAVLSIALGWLVAGRVLRPLRTMTAAARRISEQNLHERLAVAGPADELKRLGDTINDLLARLEAAFDAQRRFVANASHELRTPLTMMRTALDVATRKPDPPAPGVTILAGKIRAGLDKADRLVESFLTLARAQHGEAERRSTVALDKLATTSLADHSAVISDMHLTVGQDQHDAPVPGSEALLTHLIDNLIDNAIRHNQPGGWVRVATGTSTDTARLVVENSGPILDPSRVGELAQPFRRAAPDRTRADNTGVGLGLSIVAAIATTHHGTLDIHARPHGGLRVTVTLPLAARPALTPAATS